MINRILIRIKVVQMLYSYLLTRSEFRIEAAPEKKTRDSLYAYRLYLDLLLLILKLSGQKVIASDRTLPLLDKSGKNPLANSAIAKSLASLSELREHASKNPDYLEDFSAAISDIHAEIVESSVFKDYAKKRKREINDDLNLWATLLETVVEKNKKFEATCRESADFTLAGYRRAFQMAIATLRDYTDTRSSLVNARKSLEASLEQAHLLYYALLWLPVELTRMEAQNLDAAKEKYLPTSKDLNPDMRFVDNALVAKIEGSEKMTKYFKSNPFAWDNDYYLLKSLLDSILKSELYANYMASPSTSFEEDCEFWRSVMKDIILPSDELAESLESRSIYWNDDLNIMGTFVVKTLRRWATDKSDELTLLPMYKDGDDEKFGPELFSLSINNYKDYKELIERFVNESQWDPERLAFMDIVIMTCAIAELLHFQTIPVPVTLNEYIEIANYYSTARSGQFINGILYSIASYLKDEGKLLKDFDTRGRQGDDAEN